MAKLRAVVSETLAGEPPKKVGILAALRQLPLVGADVDTARSYRSRDRSVMRYLLDTIILSNITKPEPSASLMTWMAEQADDGLCIASLTVAEIRCAFVTH